MTAIGLLCERNCHCRTSNCTGAGGWQCCSSFPIEIDLTLPSDFFNALCSVCTGLNASTFTVVYNASANCNSIGLPSPFVWGYGQSNWCSFTDPVHGGSVPVDLCVNCNWSCTNNGSATCLHTARVNLRNQATAHRVAGAFKSSWLWSDTTSTSPVGDNCHSPASWTLPFQNFTSGSASTADWPCRPHYSDGALGDLIMAPH